VNYRANLWALKEQGAGEIVAVVSVGGIRADLGPGKIVVPHQIIDHTWGRTEHVFRKRGAVKSHRLHRAVTGELRSRLLAAQRLRRGRRRRRGLCRDQGPRLETAAEIDRLEREGADIVA